MSDTIALTEKKFPLAIATKIFKLITESGQGIPEPLLKWFPERVLGSTNIIIETVSRDVSET